jgi:hypothetical protein
MASTSSTFDANVDETTTRTQWGTERLAAWEQIKDRLRAFKGLDGFVGPCERLVGAGTKESGLKQPWRRHDT